MKRPTVVKRIPRELADLATDIQKNENLPSIQDAFRNIKNYSIIGKEVKKIAKPWGFK